MLSLRGFESYGLEFSTRAVRAAVEYARSVTSNQLQPIEEVECPIQNASGGSVKFIQGDFFEHGWQSSLPFEGRRFDLVYDYTVTTTYPYKRGSEDIWLMIF